MITIVYKVDCPCGCGGDAVRRVCDMTNPQPDGTIEIDVEMSVGQSTYTCQECGCESFIGDVDPETDGDCPGDDDGDDDEEDLGDGE